MSQQVPCRDYQSGYCRFGSNCRFYHPPSAQGGSRVPSGSTNRSNLSGGNVSASNATPLGSRMGGPSAYQFNEDTIRVELETETPQWIISSFGVAKNEPNLFFGYDTSQEELRWRSILALRENRPQGYIKEEDDLLSQAKTTISQALGNLTTTRQLAEQLHDARYPPGTVVGGPRPTDFSEASVLAGTRGGASRPTAFSAPSGPKASAFGAPAGPSAFGSSTFGKPAGGSPAFNASSSGGGTAPGASAFGASAFGAKSGPAFGSASSPTSAFGATPTSASAFGASSGPASAFGNSAPPAFGTAAKPVVGGIANSAPVSAFGAASTPVSAFTQSNTTTTPAFGATSMAAPASAFGQSAFGAPAKPVFGGSGQDRPAAPGPTAFGAPTTASVGFSSFGGAGPSSSTSSPAPAPAAFGFGASSSAAIPTAGAFGSGFANPQPVAGNPFKPIIPAVPSFTPSFSADVVIPKGWSYDDPWSWMLPTEMGSEAGGSIGEEVIKAFKAAAFELGSIPAVPPPTELRT